MSRILEDAEIEFLKKCATARKAAVQQAAKEIKKSFKKRVFDQAVSDYYDDYTPKKYKRTESLYEAFKVYATTDGRRINLSYDWDFNRLPQHTSRSQYHKYGDDWIDFYNRSEEDDNGNPEKGWIFTNFMEGIHPRFYIDKTLGILVDDSEQFTPSYIRIRQYKDNYIKSGEMRNILLRNLKKQCANI
jgi:hypothetical protein